MISGHDTKPAVKEVFTYLFNELNKPQCAKFNPDKIYVDMPAAEIPNYPASYDEITMNGLFDFEYKQNLLMPGSTKSEWKPERRGAVTGSPSFRFTCVLEESSVDNVIISCENINKSLRARPFWRMYPLR